MKIPMLGHLEAATETSYRVARYHRLTRFDVYHFFQVLLRLCERQLLQRVYLPTVLDGLPTI